MDKHAVNKDQSDREIAWFELFTVVRYAIILERKFTAMRQLNPDMGIPSNFPAEFIPALQKAVQ